MEPNLKQLSLFQFHIFSSDEIINYSVAEIKETKSLFGEGCVYDERMGPVDNTKKCASCNQTNLTCPGHFGHIILQEPVLHPMLLDEICNYLRTLCFDCHQPILSMDHLRLLKMYQQKGNYKIISTLAKKFPICVHCKHNQPTYTISEGKINYFYKNKLNRIEMNTKEIYNIFRSLKKADMKLLGLTARNHPLNMILRALPVCPPSTRPYVTMDTGICDDDLTSKYIDIIKCNKMLEKEKSESKRKSLIQTLEFHITTLFDNSKGKSRQINGRPLKGIRERINGKNGRIRNNMMGKRVDFCGRTVIGADPTLELNEVGFPQEFATNLTIPETVNRFNYNYLDSLIQQGKANYIIRDDKTFNLKYALQQKSYVREPYDMFLTSTTVMKDGKKETRWKYVYVEHWELIHKKTFVPKPSDQIMRKNGVILDSFIPKENKVFQLKYGDVVERQLRDGDRVLLNRQPTLHKGSILAPKIKILPCKTLRLPISICQSFNADFDGDEMNIHVPQSAETRAEAETIIATENNITTSQFPRPIIKICQDNLTGGYLMTLGESPGQSVSIERSVFFDAIMKLKFDMYEIDQRMEHMKRVLLEMDEVKSDEEAEKRLFTGYGLFSMILPRTLSIRYTNKLRTYQGQKEDVVIHKGIMIRGTLDSNVLGNKSNSLVHVLAKDYSNMTACDFVTHYQYITDFWLMHRGFSVGIQDCMAIPHTNWGWKPLEVGQRKQEEIHAVDPEVKRELAKAYTEVRAIMLTEKHPELKELKINTVLNNVRDMGAQIAKNNLAVGNSMKAMIESGSKGNIVNISQVIGLLGQQNVGGKRIEKRFRGRSFPHFTRQSYSSNAEDYINPHVKEERQLYELQQILESRGFIVNSYMKGLTPIEFFTHQQGGREGLLSTAISTSTTGYLQRRIVKTMEDVKSSYYNTIINQKGKVVQFAYGDDGMDTAKMVYVKGNLSFIDIFRKVDQLNNEIENKKLI
jgi:DNA-directed RNA polymerase II subunit RPB1